MPGPNSLLGSSNPGVTLPGAGGGGGGGGVSFGMLIDDVTQTAAPPADTKVRFNNTTHASATKLFVDGNAIDSTDIQSILSQIGEATAYIILRSINDPDRWFWARITQTTDQTSYVEYDIDVKDSNGGSFVTDEEITLGFDLAFDDTAIHNNKAGEINAITAKGTPVGADILLIEDSADAFNKKKITLASMPVNSHAFAGTEHTASTIAQIQTKVSDGSLFTTAAGEINALTAKVTPVAGDFVLIEDSADSFNKKRVDVANFGGGGGLNPPLSQNVDCIENTSDNGNVCFKPGSAIARGQVSIFDSQNPTRGVSITVTGASWVVDSIVGPSSYEFRSSGSNVFAMGAGSNISYTDLNPDVDNARTSGAGSLRWADVGTYGVTNSTAGGALTNTAGSGASRGSYVWKDSQGVYEDLALYVNSLGWNFRPSTSFNPALQILSSNNTHIDLRSNNGMRYNSSATNVTQHTFLGNRGGGLEGMLDMFTLPSSPYTTLRSFLGGQITGFGDIVLTGNSTGSYNGGSNTIKTITTTGGTSPILVRSGYAAGSSSFLFLEGGFDKQNIQPVQIRNGMDWDRGINLRPGFRKDSGFNNAITVTPNKLIDATKSFLTTVKVGDIVYNTTSFTAGGNFPKATVTAVDSDTELTLSSDIFTATPSGYSIQTPYNMIESDEETRLSTEFTAPIPNTDAYAGNKTFGLHKGATDEINPQVATQHTVLEAGTGYQLSMNWVKIFAIKGTFSTDPEFSLGITGDLTKYVNNQPMFGFVPSNEGDNRKVELPDSSYQDDLILTINTAEVGGTAPRIKVVVDHEKYELQA